MYVLDNYKNKIANLINTILDIDLVSADDFSYPPNSEMGDLSLPCFSLSKELKKSPTDIASTIMSNFKDCDFVSGVKIVGPYLNFTFKKDILAKDILKEISDKDNYGTNESGKKKKVMIEFTNVNTHKEYHVGHLRNLCFGNSITKIFTANGYQAIPVSYINDFGIHVAKTIWAYLNFRKNEKLPENKGYFLGETYVMANQKAKGDKTSNGMIEAIMKSIESRQGEEYELWKKTREWSIEQFDNIYKELNIELENIFYENDYIEKGLDIVGELYEKEILIKSDGAIIANLEEFNLGVLMFLRSNGTALYPVADMALAKDKFDKYQLDESIYITDNRQSLHFKQLFKTLELAGHKEKLVHLDHDFVKLPSGMMASRSGNTMSYEDLRDQLIEKIRQETKKRHADWGDDKILENAKKIAGGVIKFELLKVGANQVITFDIDKALEFNGYTAPYLQYTIARINSIIKKADENYNEKANLEELKEDKEKELIIKLAKYPEIVSSTKEKYDPSTLAKYLFELAQQFNDYYHGFQILKSENNIKLARLYLLAQTKKVLTNGLSLLGIDILEEM